MWLPDSETNFLYVLMKAEPSLTLVAVAREGLAFSTAAGLATGGKTPIILIQNTGLMESGDSLRGWGLGLNIPVVLMIGYRGWTRHGVTTDTAAVYTERFLNAFGINTISSNPTPTPRAFPWRSTKQRKTNGRLRCWLATSITASTNNRRTAMIDTAEMLKDFPPLSRQRDRGAGSRRPALGRHQQATESRCTARRSFNGRTRFICARPRPRTPE